MDKFDVVIVGNGALGLTLAYFLKKKDPNVSIALIGSSQRIGCATLVAGAMLNLWCEITDGQFENQALAEKFNLTKQGVDCWDAFAADSEVSGENIH
jgi:glycine/D-amino acid oxidase-like deaminating enzyme